MTHQESTSKPLSLAQQAATLIRARIEAGEWREVLPGETQLAAALDISRPTVRKALEILTEREILVAPKKGKARRLRESVGTGVLRSAVVNVLLPVPLHEMTPGYQGGIGQLRERLLARGREVGLVVGTRAWHGERSGTHLEAILGHHPAAAWVIIDPTPSMEAWLEQHRIPCVCVGGTYQHHLPRVGSEGNLTIRRAARLLLDLGHRRIVYPVHGTYGEQMAAHFRVALEESAVVWNESFHALRWRGHASNLFPLLERLFARPEPPTAFITLGLFNLLPLVTWLGSRRLRIPDEVSVVHILNDPLLDSFHPSLTRFTSRREKLNRATVEFVDRLMRTGQPFDEERMIPMQFHQGRSTGPPPL